MSLYLIADLDSAEGMVLLTEALKFLVRPKSNSKDPHLSLPTLSQETNSDACLTPVHNPVGVRGRTGNLAPLSFLMSHLYVNGLLENLSPTQVLNVLLGKEAAFTDSGGSQTVISLEQSINDLIGDTKLSDISAEEYTLYSHNGRRFATQLGILPGQQAVLANGRVSCLLLEPGSVLMT